VDAFEGGDKVAVMLQQRRETSRVNSEAGAGKRLRSSHSLPAGVVW